MKKNNIFLLRKIAKSRSSMLTNLIRQYASGKISESALSSALNSLYNRSDSSRSSIIPKNMVTSPDPLYQQIYNLITKTFPHREEIRPDQIESYINTVSARAVTTERLSSYSNRGVQLVQVDAVIDEVTTDICRSMHGRIFEIGNASSKINSQDSLVMSQNFWEENQYFYQTPTSSIDAWLPPYHYNCRTRIIPYIEPSEPYDAAMDRYHNLIQLREKDIDAVVNAALNMEFKNREKLQEHFIKHKNEMEVNSISEYKNLLVNLLNSPLKNIGLAISARDKTETLYIWDSKIRKLNNQEYYDLAIFSLNKNYIKSFYPKKLDEIMLNFDTNIHKKVMQITPNKVAKGDNKMVTEYDVHCYEFILDYLKENDPADEMEIISRLSYEKQWENIPDDLKQRILAVDKIILDKYADKFSYPLYKTFIDTLKKHQ